MLYETILVAQTIFSECRAKNEQEAIAIANVILNRSKGQNMERVIKKPSQFCYTQKIGKYELKNWLKSMEIARLTILGIYKDNTGGCLHYSANIPYWSKGLKRIKIGSHYFWKRIK